VSPRLGPFPDSFPTGRKNWRSPLLVARSSYNSILDYFFFKLEHKMIIKRFVESLALQWRSRGKRKSVLKVDSRIILLRPFRWLLSGLSPTMSHTNNGFQHAIAESSPRRWEWLVW
jgi:hypothetical protein